MVLEKYRHIIILFLFGSFVNITIQDPTDCKVEEFPRTRTFSSLQEYQESRVSFNPHHFNYEGNVVAFSFDTLEEIPKNAFISFGSDSIVQLILERKHIKKIEIGAFLGLRCLNELDLRYNNLTEIMEGTFEGLSQLENLWLNNNLLESTPDSGMAFLHLVNLRQLHMANNRIKSLQKIAFDSLTNLELLDLSYNKIRVIEDTVFNSLVNLNTLLLNNNYLTKITPQNWENLAKLYSLNLADNFLTTFDVGYNFSFANLSQLDLSGNSLTQLDGAGMKLSFPYLRELNIQNNFWTCEHLNAFRSSLYGLKNVHLSERVKCRTERTIDWSIPTPPPEDTVDVVKSSSTMLLDYMKNNISTEIRREISVENMEVMKKILYIQNLLTFLSVTVVICFVLIIFVKLQVFQVISNSFGIRQSNYVDPEGNYSNGPESYRLIGR